MPYDAVMRPDTAAAPRPQRRTQAERREATRTALLDATVECLVEFGYVQMTTARVADRAGVSRGAQIHYFENKAAMVTAAVDHLAHRRIHEFSERIARLPTDDRRLGSLLDLLWEAHEGEVFTATLELWVAARTDAVLQTELMALERGVAQTTLRLAGELMGEEATRPGFREDLEFALATVRGIALLGMASGENSRAVRRHWRAARERLLLVIAAPAAP